MSKENLKCACGWEGPTAPAFIEQTETKPLHAPCPACGKALDVGVDALREAARQFDKNRAAKEREVAELEATREQRASKAAQEVYDSIIKEPILREGEHAHVWGYNEMKGYYTCTVPECGEPHETAPASVRATFSAG